MPNDEERFFDDCLAIVHELRYVFEDDMKFHEELLVYIFLGDLTFQSLDDYNASRCDPAHYFHRFCAFMEKAIGQYGDRIDDAILFSHIDNLSELTLRNPELHKNIIEFLGPKTTQLMKSTGP